MLMDSGSVEDIGTSGWENYGDGTWRETSHPVNK